MLLDIVLWHLLMVRTVDMGERMSMPYMRLPVHAAVTAVMMQRNRCVIVHVIGCERGTWLSVWTNCRERLQCWQ